MFNHRHWEDSFLTFSTCMVIPVIPGNPRVATDNLSNIPALDMSSPAQALSTSNQSKTICNKWVPCAQPSHANNLKWVYCAQSSEANYLKWLLCAQSSQSHRIKWVQSCPTHKCVS